MKGTAGPDQFKRHQHQQSTGMCWKSQKSILRIRHKYYQILSAVGRSQVLQGNTSMAHIRSDTLQKKNLGIGRFPHLPFTYPSTAGLLSPSLFLCQFPIFSLTYTVHMYLGKSLLNLHLKFQLVLTKLNPNHVKSCEKSGEIT